MCSRLVHIEQTKCCVIEENNPGKTITINDLPGIIKAWPLAAVQKKTSHKGFEAAGIFLFNPEIFKDADCAPSFVTDRP